MNCYCGSKNKFENCCEPLLKLAQHASTAEKLMRSRYSAFVTKNIKYLKNTLASESRSDFDEKSTKEWADQAEWLGLEILSTTEGQESDSKGTVEFMAKYKVNNEVLEHHEVAHFSKDSKGIWYFVDGDGHTHKEGETHTHHKKVETFQREGDKVGRNEPCPCGSGKKYKKCCAA